MSIIPSEISRAVTTQPPVKLQLADDPPSAITESQLTELVMGGLAAQAVYVAAKLGIADLLENGPRDIASIAKESNTDADSLYRVLRALASFGVFAENEERTFQLTPMAELLRSKAQGSLRDVAIFMGEDWHWQVWGKALYSVRTGKPAWSEVHGQEVFPYFATNQKAAKIFDDAMSSSSSLATAAVVEAYDFSTFDTLVDVAGGHGRLLTSILAANKALRGVLFDVPHVVAGAREKVERAGLSSRCELTTGDFFISVPPGADAYIMKHIIHDWDDDHATRILQNIRAAMRTDAKVLLVEAVIAEGNEKDFGKLLDIEMLVSPGGKERTAAEYERLFLRAGLRLSRIVPTKSPFSVIEAVAQ